YNNAPFDLGGRYIYLRDDATGESWSPSWQPTQSALDAYECRHGLSYTSIAATHGGVRAETLYCVPLGQTLEVWRLRLANLTGERRPLSVFSSVEFCLWDAQDDGTNFQRNFSTGEVEVEGSVIYHKTEYRERRNHFAFFACSETLAGFDTAREAFLGPYRGFDRPIAVERGSAGNSMAHGWAPHGSHHVRLELGPREEREIIFVLGYSENPVAEKFDPPGSQVINKRTVRPVIDHSLQHANGMVNAWNAYQCMVTFTLSRSTSFYESGIGRGMGFRDSNQDLLGFVQMIPERARQRILDIAATQLSTGGAYHQYQPLTKRGNNDIGSGFN